MTSRRSLLLALPLACLLAAPAPAARHEPLPRGARLEHHLELPEGGAPELTLRLKLPLRLLVFERRPEDYRAHVRIACRLENRQDGRVETALLHDTLSRPDFAATRDREAIYEKEFQLPVTPGRWRLEALVYGRGNRSPWRAQLDLDIPGPEEGTFFVQEPRWADTPPAAGRITPPFRFRDPWQLGGDAGRFVDGLDGQLGLETDLIFWEGAAGEAEATLRLSDRAGEDRHYARQRVAAGPGRRRLAWQLPVADLAPGAYRVDVQVEAGGERRGVTARLDVGLTRAAFGSRWDDTLDLIRILVAPDEWLELETAVASDRPRVWDDFWARRDPNGAEPGNDALERFCQRLTEANENFTNAYGPGYRTDRGQVWLELGAPDRTDLIQDERSFRVREYWYYDRLGRTYVFEDRHGYGDFDLVQVLN